MVRMHKKGKHMKITFLGATKTVTGSNFLVEAAGKRFLVDCGMYQAKAELELENYNPEIAKRPQVIAANKTDMIFIQEGEEDPVERLRKEFEPKGIKVYPISALSGEGIRELLYEVRHMLDGIDEKPIVFEQEFFPEYMLADSDEPYSVTYDEESDEYVVEGPRIEKMLGYTNLESEKGFTFFQNFLKLNGILEQLEELGIQEGDTVRMYGLSFDYYK